MRIYGYIELLCSSFDDDICLWRDRHFTAFFGFDRNDRVEGAVVVSCIISVGMRDDGFRKILFDRRAISKVPGKGHYFIASIIEHACRSIECYIEGIGSYA
jgi:hypothetical protein